MFTDQKEYLQLTNIVSDVICTAIVYYLFIPLILKFSGDFIPFAPPPVIPGVGGTLPLFSTRLVWVFSPFFIVLPALLRMQLHRYVRHAPKQIKSIGIHAAAQTLIFIFIFQGFLFFFDCPPSRKMPLLIGIGALLWMLLTVKEIYLLHELKKKNAAGNIIKHILLVDTGPGSRAVAHYIKKNPECGLRLDGFILTPDNPENTEKINPSSHNILGTSEDLIHILHKNHANCVVCPDVISNSKHFDFILKSCASMGIDFAVTTDLPPPDATGNCRRISSEKIGNMNFALIQFVYLRPVAVFFKRMFDFTAASVGIALCLPLWITISIAIKSTSPGPVFFKQQRLGQHGRRFTLFKFRSMVTGAEKMQENLMHLNEMDGPAFKIKKDPRQTITGKLLRKTSLDELPQIFNVFRGDISLVGPRPALEKEVVQYRPIERKRLAVPQGITCIWQISGRNDIKFDEWMKLDLMYIDNRSTAQDIRILLHTIPAVLLRKGAC